MARGILGNRTGDKENYWRAQISSWKRSGETQSGFCRRRGLSRDQFTYWKRRLAESADGAQSLPALVEVPREMVALQRGGEEERVAGGRSLVVRIGRYTIEVPMGDFDAQVFSSVVDALERRR